MRAACQHLQQSVTLSEATSQSSDNKACQPHAAPQGDLWQVHICSPAVTAHIAWTQLERHDV